MSAECKNVDNGIVGWMVKNCASGAACVSEIVSVRDVFIIVCDFIVGDSGKPSSVMTILPDVSDSANRIVSCDFVWTLNAFCMSLFGHVWAEKDFHAVDVVMCRASADFIMDELSES